MLTIPHGQGIAYQITPNTVLQHYGQAQEKILQELIIAKD